MQALFLVTPAPSVHEIGTALFFSETAQHCRDGYFTDIATKQMIYFARCAPSAVNHQIKQARGDGPAPWFDRWPGWSRWAVIKK